MNLVFGLLILGDRPIFTLPGASTFQKARGYSLLSPLPWCPSYAVLDAA
jgi:hypothetical protein